MSILRRLLVLLALSLVWVAAGGSDALPAVADDEVHVQRAGKGFVVDVVLHAPVAPALAWAVLTDFDHMASFVPNLRSSRVVERGEQSLQVAQAGTARHGFVAIEFESVREIRLVGQREIHAHGLSGSARHMDSVMRIDGEPGGTRMQYHAEVEPDFWLPPLLGPAWIRHEMAEQFSAILQEMVRRH